MALGTPLENQPGLYIFSYQFAEDASLRVPPSKGTRVTPARSYTLRCLLMTNPAEDYAALDEGRKCLKDRPVITLQDKTINAMLTLLSTDELTQIFSSAGVTLRLAIAFELRWTGA